MQWTTATATYPSRCRGWEGQKEIRKRKSARLVAALDLGHRIHGAKLRRRTVVRAVDPRCSCGGRGEASRGGRARGGGGGLDLGRRIDGEGGGVWLRAADARSSCGGRGHSSRGGGGLGQGRTGAAAYWGRGAGADWGGGVLERVWNCRRTGGRGEVARGEVR
jgi:hypothetical protein